MFSSGPAQLGITAVVLAIFGHRFLLWERQRRGVKVVVALWWVTLLDALIYPDVDASRATSFFHPVALGQNFRLIELLLPLALVVRIHVHGWPKRFDVSGPVWMGFYAYAFVATFSGFVQGFESGLILTEGAILIYVGCAMVLAAGVPLRDYVEDAVLLPLVRWSAACALLVFVLNETNVRLTTSAIPNLPIDRFGLFGADAASLLPVVGLFAIGAELSRRTGGRRRATVLLPGAFLILSHVGTTQRAARLDLYLTLLIIGLACLSRNRRRFRVSGTQLSLTLVGVVALALIGPTFVESVSAAVQGRQAQVSIPLAGQTAKALDTGRRQGSIQSRYNQWEAVLNLIKEKPIEGWGMGKTYIHYEVGFGYWKQGITHNLVLDLMFRMGLIGSVLWWGGIVGLLLGGFRAWRTALDDRVGALGLILAAATMGLLARGMVESIFEKYKLAVGLGILLGLLIASRTATDDDGPAAVGEPVDLVKRPPAPEAEALSA